MVCEYDLISGNPKYYYNLATDNPNYVVTQCAAPIAQAATNIGCFNFTANWNSAAGASKY